VKIKLITPQIFNKHKVLCAVSTKHGGVSEETYRMNLSFRVGDSPENVNENRRILFEHLGIPEDRLVYQGQIHSCNSHYAENPGTIKNNDAVFTDKENLFLTVTIADCLPVFLYHPGGIIAAIHSGWRGSVKKITEKTLIKICEHFAVKPSEFLAFLGPALSVDNFEVGSEVAALFRKEVITSYNGKYYLDNKLENYLQLIESGLKEENIESSVLCTFTESSLLHSYRRDKNYSGRMLGIIGNQRC